MAGVIAVYVRISLEDVDKNEKEKAESCSLINQKRLIEAYIQSHKDLSAMTVSCFSDDGCTGTNFERPDFRRMLSLAYRREIDCIIVKDFSRLGRNYLEMGDYVDRIFPSLGIRLISIGDQYDSRDKIGETAGVAVAFQNLIYESYSRDLSVKVKTAMRTRMEQGKYVNHPPYGYRKDPKDKHHLIPDPESAVIVQEIFQRIINGQSTSEVATELNRRGVPTPSVYKKHKRNENLQGIRVQWTHPRIVDILHNLKYTGVMVNHTRENRYLRDNNQRRTGKEEWIISEGTHEALVSEEDFKAANQMLRHPAPFEHKRQLRADSVFYCGLCGRKLRKTHGSDIYFSCDTPSYQQEAACRGIKWSRTELEKVLLPLYETHVLLLPEKERQKPDKEERRAALAKEAAKSESELAAYKQEKLRLYEAYRDGVMDREEYLKRKEILMVRQNEMEVLLKAATSRKPEDRDGSADPSETDSGKNHPDTGSLSREELCARMYAAIDRVKVYSNDRIEVTWKGTDPFDEMKRVEVELHTA